MTTLTPHQYHIIAPRPKVFPENSTAAGLPIPDHFLIFNAPRPLYASFLVDPADKTKVLPAAWVDGFLHGIHFVAVDPGETVCIAENISLDGWLIIYHTKKEVIAWAEKYCQERKICFDDFEEKDFRDAFLLRADRGEFDEPGEPHEN